MVCARLGDANNSPSVKLIDNQKALFGHASISPVDNCRPFVVASEEQINLFFARLLEWSAIGEIALILALPGSEMSLKCIFDCLIVCFVV